VSESIAGSRPTILVPIDPTPDAEVVDVRLSVASQWKLMWWRFRRHKLALVSVAVVALFYLIAIFAEFIAPGDPWQVNGLYKYVSPQGIALQGLRPGTHALVASRDPETLRLSYVPDPEQWFPIRLFVRGPEYRLWGVVQTDVHLFGLGPEAAEQPFFLLGTDRLGRDLFSQIIYGTRVSLSIGLIGVLMSLTIGIVLGGVSGYYGGVADMTVQRLVEVFRSMPTIPLLMGLGAALPTKWPVEYTFFAITIILGIVGWTGLARVVRGRFLSLREEDFVLAARLAGSGERRIIFRHMLPSFSSHIIATVTLAIPGMILNETALSFLGLGLREPAISWGVLLQSAQNIQTVSLYPWLLAPVVPVVVISLAFNFFGDGMRDAADPYGR